MNQKHFISTTTMPVLVATAPGMVVMCNEELLSIKSHDPFGHILSFSFYTICRFRMQMPTSSPNSC